MDASLLGREPELALLIERLERAAAGEPSLLMCGGEPGIGKTRLAEELALMARGRGWPVVWGRAVEAEGAPPYWPWRQVLRELSGTAAGSSIAVELGVAGELAMLAPEAFAAVVPGEAGASLEMADSPERRFRVFDAATRYLRAVAAGGRLLVVLDDVHWADPASLLLLQHVAQDLGSAPLLLLATYRDTEPGLGPVLADLVREPATRRLVLSPLGLDAVGLQLAALTGRTRPERTVARVHELTGGNPFFVGEMARALGASDVPAGVPATVRGAIRQRMDRLTPRCRHQLRAAAVLGRQFSMAVAAAVVGQPVLTSLELWDEAIAAGLLAPAGEGELRFAHALVCDAIEADLPAPERVRLHAAAAQAIEAYFVGRLEPHLADLARHWAATLSGAADPDSDHAVERVVEWSRRAGDEALRRLSYEDAVRLYRQALEAGGTNGRVDDLARYHLLISLTRGLAHSADVGEAFGTCGQAAEVARRLGRNDLLAEAALVLEPTAVIRLDAGLHELCVEAVRELGREETPLRARLLARLAITSVYIGRLAEAAGASEQALAVAAASGDTAALVSALRARHLVCSGADGVDERDELAVGLLALGDRHDDPPTRLLASSWRIDVRFARGDLAGVAAELENLDWWVRESGGPTARWHLLRYRAALAQARGEFQAARRLADEAFAAIAPLRHPAGFPVRMALLVSVDHHCGADPQAPHVLACLDAGPGGPATPGHAFRIMDYLGPAMVLQEAGYLDEASAKLRALGPVPTWGVPPFHQLIMYAFGTVVAIRAGADDAVSDLRALLRPFHGRHVVSGTGVEHYLGPVELYLGLASGHLGDLDAAVDELTAAVRACESAGAVAHLVEARCELATVLARRGDTARAQSLAGRAIRDADALGMAPWRTRLARLAEPQIRAGGPLTPREYEVAVAVARGLTNRQIAAELHLSERTAQNHVQHILTKLGFTNRSQIAVWVADLSTRVE